MTKRHFEAVAALLRRHAALPGTAQVAHDLADLYAAANPRFDRARFLRAALGEEN